MARGVLNKYVWILETIQKYGRISREELGGLWKEAHDVSNGEPLARRTFYNYRLAIEELFGIRIGYSDSTYEYFIEDGGDAGGMSSWLINSMSVNGMLSDASGLSERIMLEEVPSAKEFLPQVIEAMKHSRKIVFSYSPFYRVSVTDGIVVEPYFVRIFRQRWYLIGYNTAEKKIKTYSLDRIRKIAISEEMFVMPDITVREFFRDCVGITTSSGEAKRITIKVVSDQAKYLRALPLHESQQEQVCNGYSLFHYHLHITYDLVQEVLSHGEKWVVLSPPELKAAIVDSLQKSVDNYTLPTTL